jgi:hypothetical protein
MEDRDWWFHWDNAHLHTVAMVTNMMETRQFTIIEKPSYLPDLAPVADQTLTQETLKMEWEEGCENPLSDGFHHRLLAVKTSAVRSASRSPVAMLRKT